MSTSSSLTMRLECPLPVVSSSSKTLPAGKRLTAPSLVVTSYSPRRLHINWRRGAQNSALRGWEERGNVERWRWWSELDRFKIDIDLNEVRLALRIRK